MCVEKIRSSVLGLVRLRSTIQSSGHGEKAVRCMDLDIHALNLGKSSEL